MFLFRFIRHPKVYGQLQSMSSAHLSTSSKAMTEKVVEELQANPFYSKYAGKIAVLQQFSPEEFEARANSFEEKKKKQPPSKKQERPFSTVSAQSKPKIDLNAHTRPKCLNDIMKTDLLKDKSADEIKQLWLDYHKTKDVIAGVIPKNTYQTLYDRGMEFSTFILPVPRSEGYEFIVSQFVGHEIHFTPLIAYQTHKENAPACLTITHYPDIQDEKGVVLMKGEFNTDILNCQEAQCLANELQLYYAQNNEKRFEILKKFTSSPSEFKHMDLIKELESLSL